MGIKRMLKKKHGTRRELIKLLFVLGIRTATKYEREWLCERPVAMWRACELLWRRKSYTDRLYSLTPDHPNFHIKHKE